MPKYLKYTLLALLWGGVAAYLLYAGGKVRRHRAEQPVTRIEVEVVDSTSQLRLVSEATVRGWLARSGIKTVGEKIGAVRLDALEQKAVKLLHSKTGACIARGVFGQPDAVYDAIFWHTTGKADMTTLEKVLYIADYMEPNRDFDGVERLRHLAYTDLDKAMLLGVEMTIQEMQQRQVPIHTNTLQARDWLRQHGVTTED